MSIHFAITENTAYEGGWIVGIFDTREEAEAFVQANAEGSYDLRIEAWDGGRELLARELREHTADGWPVRGTVPSSSIVEWVGPHMPPFGGGYAIEGVDDFRLTTT